MGDLVVEVHVPLTKSTELEEGEYAFPWIDDISEFVASLDETPKYDGATTHDDPVYIVDGIIHYCVANMPGAVARTSAFALNNATLPFAVRLANLGAEAAMKADPHLAAGLNVANGQIRHEAVADALELPFVA